MVKKVAKPNTKRSISPAAAKKAMDSAMQKYYSQYDFKSFGASLQKTLQDKNMSISSLSKLSGISRMQIYNIINGKKEPKASTLFSILKTLGFKIKIV